jgi:hypothetical protein
MNMKVVVMVLLGIAILSLLRIVMQWRSVARRHSSDWDEQFIHQLRKAGVNLFEPQVVDFFFTVPDARGSNAIASLLRAEGYEVDARPDAETGKLSVHAQHTMRLLVPEMQALTARFKALAGEHGGTYDNWAVGKSNKAE